MKLLAMGFRINTLEVRNSIILMTGNCSICIPDSILHTHSLLVVLALNLYLCTYYVLIRDTVHCKFKTIRSNKAR